jgi:hypothetical protein
MNKFTKRPRKVRPEQADEIIAKALPVNRVPEMYDFAKRLMDAATIVGALRRHGYEIVKL